MHYLVFRRLVAKKIEEGTWRTFRGEVPWFWSDHWTADRVCGLRRELLDVVEPDYKMHCLVFRRPDAKKMAEGTWRTFGGEVPWFWSDHWTTDRVCGLIRELLDVFEPDYECITSFFDVWTRRKLKKGLEGLSEGKYHGFDPISELHIGFVVRQEDC